MNIVKYIIEILKENEKLFVPGLGYFTIEHKPSTIHPIEHSFLPPSKEIVFTSSISMTSDDDLLVRRISEDEHISLIEALNYVTIFSDSLLSDIQKGKLAGIEGLGVFSLTDDHQIAFITETSVFSDEEFGLTSFTSPAIVKTEFKDKAASNAQKAKDEKLKRSKRIKKYLIVTAIVLVITALIFLVLFTDIFRNYLYNNEIISEQKIEKTSVLKVKPHVQDIKNDTSASLEDSLSVNLKSDVLEKVKKTDIKISVNENQQDGNQYYLIAGSYKSEENANKSVSGLIAKGFKKSGIIRQSKNGMYIVYYESYSVKEEASKALLQIQKTENHDSWLLKK